MRRSSKKSTGKEESIRNLRRRNKPKERREKPIESNGRKNESLQETKTEMRLKEIWKELRN